MQQPDMICLYDSDGGRVGTLCTSTGRAQIGAMFYVPERACEDANTRFNAWTCSECKATLLLMFDDYGEPTYSVDGVADIPNYCPNCGARVREAE